MTQPTTPTNDTTRPNDDHQPRQFGGTYPPRKGHELAPALTLLRWAGSIGRPRQPLAAGSSSAQTDPKPTQKERKETLRNGGASPFFWYRFPSGSPDPIRERVKK